MAKSKSLTPQEIYKQKKEREERERTAYLPPGLINHGNTCFMNSVLQGLIATRLLSDLVHFDPIPAEIQRTAATPIVSRRSPQLTNGHNLAGPYEHPWVNTMPIGDMFLTLVYKAWESQMMRRREILSPKSILGALGQKYDQYLDFAQQDAHEFLRILLDAMRMEEQDIIKKRQPPPPKNQKKRRRTTITSGNSPQIPVSESTSQPTRQATNREATPSTSTEKPADQHSDQAENSDNDLPLLSFADMLFSGQLSSILVCQKCKHVSQTYEEFNDISLSIKAEDYFPHNRKRDRFKKIVGRLTTLPGSSSQPKDSRKPAIHLPVAPSQLIEMQRSSSVPPSPRTEGKPLGGDDEQPVSEPPRRRSLDVSVGVPISEPDIPAISTQGPTPVVEVADFQPSSGPSASESERQDDGGMESEHSHILVNVTGPDDKHVEFAEPKRGWKAKNGLNQSDSTDTEDMGKDLGSSKDKEKEGKEKEKEKSKQDDGWAKIGRRISMSVGLGRPKGGDKDRKDKDRKSRSMDRGGGLSSHIKEIKEIAIGAADLGIQKSLSAIVPSSKAAKESSPDKRRIASDGRSSPSSNAVASSSDVIAPKPSKPLPNPPVSSPSNSSLTAGTNTLSVNTPSAAPSMFPHVQRSKSPKPPKPTSAEAEYLRKILADVSTSSLSNSPFSIFKPPLVHSHSSHHSTRPLSTQMSVLTGGVGHHHTEKNAGASWLGIGMRNFSGLEECLRMFTAVEVLDGENMVGCRRCWKIQNGVYHGSKGKQEDSDQEEQEEEEERLPFEGGSGGKDPVTVNGVVDPSAKKVPHPLQVVTPSLSRSTTVHIPTSISTPTVSMYSQADMSDTRSISSLPTAATSASDLNLGVLKESDESGDSRVSLSIISEGSSKASNDSDIERPGPGGLPIPVISTTSPPDTPKSWSVDDSPTPKVLGDNPDANRNASYARLIGADNGPASPSTSTPSPHPKFTQALYGYNASSSGSKDSLLIPQIGHNRYQKRRSYAEATFTDNDSSGDESDTSIGTSISADSVRSSTSQGATIAVSPLNGIKVQSSIASPSNPQTQPSSASVAPAPKKASKPPKPVIMRPAYKRYLIAVPPPVLVIHLKRFQQTSKTPLMSFSHGFKKLEDYISFPEHLDLLPFLAPRKEDYGLGKKSKGKEHKVKGKEERCMYRLYAVVVHIGNMLGGHYIAYTSLPENPSQPSHPAAANGAGGATPASSFASETSGDNENANGDSSHPPKPTPERQWAYISDTTVRLTTLEEVLHAKAYICMYERC
ncbi:hypothetical protein CVT25_011439 [Psilocybe cyanescens]|uniref:ubiquitinyl hydrolase 1 n=1 Tax=Psilocybe cyanescens TaxID=93625 RepID=A0A409XA86_PSICY|nr:hypothetical protein CVT25_011439 [Psilocybe cyanescens]